MLTDEGKKYLRKFKAFENFEENLLKEKKLFG